MQQTTKPDLCPVETKIKAAFVCQHRPLLPGEKPKRAGQDTVFEATGEVHSELLALLQSSNSEQHHVHVTVKHDGMCSKIVRTQDGIRVMRRYDVRKGKKPPAGSFPAGLNDHGLVEFYWYGLNPFRSTPTDFRWIDITDNFSPDNQQYHASMTKSEDGRIEKVAMIVSDTNGGHMIVDMPVGEIVEGTYELVGPKVQGNPYRLPAETKVPIPITKKGKLTQIQAEKHYFVRHGSFQINTLFSEAVREFTLESLRDFIISRRIEGIVFHFPNKCMYKVNRGHIGVELTKDDILQINLKQ